MNENEMLNPTAVETNEAAVAKSVEGEALKFAPLDEGAVCFTQGYNLPARYIIHSEELKNKFTGADNIE